MTEEEIAELRTLDELVRTDAQRWETLLQMARKTDPDMHLVEELKLMREDLPRWIALVERRKELSLKQRRLRAEAFAAEAQRRRDAEANWLMG